MEPETQTHRFESRIRRSSLGVFYWTAAWLLATAALAFGPKFLWNEATAVTLAAFALNIVIGIGLIVANKKHLQALDDLHRKVLLDAMGVTLGVVLILGVPVGLLNSYEVLPFEPGVAHLYIVMSLTFVGAILLGLRRYR